MELPDFKSGYSVTREDMVFSNKTYEVCRFLEIYGLKNDFHLLK